MSPAPSGLLRRLATAAILLPLVIYLIHWAPPLAFAVLMLLVLTAGAFEFFELAEASGLRAERVVGVAGVVLCLAAISATLTGPFELVLGLLTPLRVVVAAALLTPAVIMVRKAPVQAVLPGTATVVFGVVYLGVLGGSLIALRLLPRGSVLVLALLAITWGSDTGAFLTGNLVGRRKLAPRLSPGKTLEGAAGGLVFAAAAGAVVARLAGLPMLSFVVLAVVLGLVSQLGDLTESALKRAAGRKDSGSVFPGHGGVLDRLDSLLFAAPVMYHYWQLFVLQLD